MEPVPYTITLKAPATVRVVDYDVSEKRAYVSSVAVRDSMRRTLRQLVEDCHLPPGIEFELFGELRPDGFARASAFRISGASGATSRLELESQAQIILPRGTVLDGFLQTDVPNSSPQGLAIFMSLIGVHSLEVTPASDGVPCTMSANTSQFDLEELYTLNHISDESNLHRVANRWLPEVRRTIISYFAGRPEEMYRMPSRAFEKLVAELLRGEGFDVSLTPETRDGGYDILALRQEQITGDDVVLIECKRYARSKKISVGLVRGLVGVVQLENATKGMLVTTSHLTGPAKTLIGENSSRLVAHDYEALVRWLNEA